jgi:3-hydroxybutyryl-CoA dehydrogenase
MGGAGEMQQTAVIGAGLMGHGIAQVLAQGNCRVGVYDTDQTVLQNAEARIKSNLIALSNKGLEKAECITDIMSRIHFATDLHEAVNGADFVIESVSENLQLKMKLFEEIECFVSPQTIIGSNTSMLKISDIGQRVVRKDRLLVTHWFNPPYLIPVVEVVKGAETATETVEKTVTFLESMKKLPVRVLKEVPGHLINRIQFAIFRETLGLLEQGVATAEEIDKGVSGSLGLRFATVGPLRSIDMAGLDLFVSGMKDMYSSLNNALEPQQVLQEKVKAGDIGRKSGKGFFEYQTGVLVSAEERERDDRIMELLKILHPKKENAHEC